MTIAWDKKNRSIVDDGGKQPALTVKSAAAKLATGGKKSATPPVKPGMKRPK